MDKLFYGDNLDILRKKIRAETIDLCYIDPPFNSTLIGSRALTVYDDAHGPSTTNQ